MVKVADGVSTGKKPVEIERLLHWAYRDELAKEDISSAEGIWDRIALGTPIDLGHGGGQRYAHFGLPHPDAYRIAQAVTRLEDLASDRIDPDWLMGPLAALYRARDVILVRTLRTSALVTMHAKMGSRPDWYSEPPRPRQMMARRGPNVEVVGKSKGKNLYRHGSYCPLRWEPSPIDIAEGRAEYAAWWLGLDLLASSLELADHIALPPAVPANPWDVPAGLAAVHVVNEDVALEPKLPLKPARRRAGPRRMTPRAGPCRTVVPGPTP